MNLTYINKESRPRLLLIFAGWSTDPSAFADLKVDAYDVAVAWDYTTLDFPAVSGYEEVVVLAWSLGVWAASEVLPGSGLPVTLAIAVNGTPSPVSDTTGIPSAIFRATAANLTEPALAKFRRRMGAPSLPRGNRSIESLAAELMAVDAVGAARHGFEWDRAVVSSGDAIFPPANQRAAWAGTRTAILEISGPHTPESWQRIVDSFVIDKGLVRKRFTRGMATYADEASVQQRVAAHLLELWRKHSRDSGGRVLEIGYGDGSFTRMFAPVIKPAELLLWDLVEMPMEGVVTRGCDAEVCITSVAPGSFDAIVSASTIQWFNSPARFIRNAASALRSGGLLVLSTFGPATFGELTQAGVVPLPYLSVETLRASVPESMELLECHDGIITKVFPTPADVLHHLRDTGVNARPVTSSVRRILCDYPLRPDGRAALTYNPVYLILQKK